MSSSSTSGNISEGNKNTIWKRYLHFLLIAVLFLLAKTRNQPKCLWINEWIKKLCIYTIKIFQLLKKGKVNPAIFYNIDDIMLREISQTEKDKYCMLSLICEI